MRARAEQSWGGFAAATGFQWQQRAGRAKCAGPWERGASGALRSVLTAGLLSGRLITVVYPAPKRLALLGHKAPTCCPPNYPLDQTGVACREGKDPPS
ncbi:unannotated protein [freshwater metagenome]|uniref:Unannotated protein n=1 Tax=freshwater metagenome TaxID=449393 RepID=A0A6J7S4E6_9ZZZZ